MAIQVPLYSIAVTKSLVFIGGAANSYNGAVFINKDVQNFLKQNIEDINFSNSDNNDDNDNNNGTDDNNDDDNNNNNNDDDNNYDNPDAA